MVTRAKLLAGLSYLGILCFVPLMFGRGDRFVNFHARQGLVIWIWGVVSLIVLPLPFGRLFFSLSSTTILVFSLIGVASVALGNTWKLPIVSDLADRL